MINYNRPDRQEIDYFIIYIRHLLGKANILQPNRVDEGNLFL